MLNSKKPLHELIPELLKGVEEREAEMLTDLINLDDNVTLKGGKWVTGDEDGV